MSENFSYVQSCLRGLPDMELSRNTRCIGGLFLHIGVEDFFRTLSCLGEALSYIELTKRTPPIQRAV